MKKVWCLDPMSGGTKIPKDQHQVILAQAAAYEEKQSWYPRCKLKLRFSGQFCYLYGQKEGREPFPIGRLRYFTSYGWSLSFYAYSSESYKPCMFNNGWFGTLEEGIDKCSGYLQY